MGLDCEGEVALVTTLSSEELKVSQRKEARERLSRAKEKQAQAEREASARREAESGAFGGLDLIIAHTSIYGNNH